MKKIILVLGGIRSGKSHFAEEKSLFYDDKPAYIATAVPFDEEMKERIKIHKKRRGDRFRTFEETSDIRIILREMYNKTVLVDCMTVNLSNRLMQRENKLSLKEMLSQDNDYLRDIEKIAEKNSLKLILVSNEVGNSPVEINKMGRMFQDLQGNWNRIMADFADEVYFVRAGIPSIIKKRSISPFRKGSPSYLRPGGYIENVNYLMDNVSDIQLLLFDSMEDDPLFSKETLMTLKFLASDSELTYTAHMQVKPHLLDDFEKRLKLTLSTIEKLEMLDILSYTFHFDLPLGKKWEDLAEPDITEIEDKYILFFKKVLGSYPDINISFENTGTPLSALDRVVRETGISYCIDIGHLIFQNRDLSEIETRLNNTTVVHIHGVESVNGKETDHRSLVYDRKIFQMLESFKGVVTIENYHPAVFKKSMNIIEEYF